MRSMNIKELMKQRTNAMIVFAAVSVLSVAIVGCVPVAVPPAPDNSETSDAQAEATDTVDTATPEGTQEDNTEAPVDAGEENTETEIDDKEPSEENYDDSLIIEDTMGALPEKILEKVSGHYDDGQGDTVDISFGDHMVRFIKGGKQDHIYDEKIRGYKIIRGIGYLIKVEWDGEKYSYLYTKEGDTEYLYPNFDEGWDPNLNPYEHMEGLQEYVKDGTSDAADGGADISAQSDSLQYNAGTIELIKEGNDYYMCPKYPGVIPAANGEGQYMLPGKVRIAPTARVGITSDFYITSDGECESGHFTYEYYNFYDVADKKLSAKQWFYNGDYMEFDCEGNDMPLTPLISFDENGDIILFCEYYCP